MDNDRRFAPIPLEFAGTAGEYFRIWIVNITLSLLTLGIYSAWAKVRQKRYFYGNTRLAGSSFDYVADPIAILKGRAIAFLCIATYALSAEFMPILSSVLTLAFVLALPWLIIRALRFNAVNTVLRNLRFDFRSNYGTAAANYLALPLVAGVTLGLAYPYMVREQKRFMVENSRYGDAAFQFSANTGDFWKLYLKMSAIVFVPFVVLGIFVVVAVQALQVDGRAIPPQWTAAAATVPQILILMSGLAAMAYLQAAQTNLIWNNTALEGMRFQCRLSFPTMLGLYFTNVLAIMLSFGLAIPWAQIRMARYRIESLGLHATQDELERFIGQQPAAVSAFGSEMSDLLDVDIGL